MLDKAERQRDEAGRLLPGGGNQVKAETLRAAGVSTSAAHRAERIAAIPDDEKPTAQEASGAEIST